MIVICCAKPVFIHNENIKIEREEKKSSKQNRNKNKKVNNKRTFADWQKDTHEKAYRPSRKYILVDSGRKTVTAYHHATYIQ